MREPLLNAGHRVWVKDLDIREVNIMRGQISDENVDSRSRAISKTLEPKDHVNLNSRPRLKYVPEEDKCRQNRGVDRQILSNLQSTIPLPTSYGRSTFNDSAVRRERRTPSSERV